MSEVYEAVQQVGSEKELQGNAQQEIVQDVNEVYRQNKPYMGAAPAKASYKESAMTLIKGYIGSGILALPYSFYIGGWLFATILFIISVIVLMFCVKLLIEVGEAENKENQGLTEVSEITYGNSGKLITKIILISYQLGKSVAYLIFFIQFFAHVLSDVDENQGAGSFIYFIFALCVVLPMSFIDNMALFAKLSLFGNTFSLIGLSYIIFYNCYQILNSETLKDNISNVMHITQFPIVLGVVVYGMGIIPIAFAIRVTMQDQSKFQRLFDVVTTFNICLYIIFPIFCVWGMGDSIKQIILFSLVPSPQTYMIQICYAMGLICSYPLQILPAFQQIERIEYLKGYINPQVKYSRFRRLLIRFVLNVLIALTGYVVPQFAHFINVLGSLGGASLNYVLPALVHQRYFKNDQQKLRNQYYYIGIIAFGVIGGLCSFVYSLIKLIQH